jgi:uncharacterized protein YukE
MRSIAEGLDSLASELTSVRSTLDEAVGGSSDFWKGEDADRFRHEWSRSHSPSLGSASTEASNAASSLRSEAWRQDQASDVL